MIAAADDWAQETARGEAVARRLITAPGVGPVTALSVQATVDDVTRFRGPGTLSAYLGGVLREARSGKRHQRGPITKQGPHGSAPPSSKRVGPSGARPGTVRRCMPGSTTWRIDAENGSRSSRWLAA